MKEWMQARLILFFYLFCLQWNTEYFISAFYSCQFFFISFPSLSILVYLWKGKNTVRHSLCERSPDKWAGGTLIPGKGRVFLYSTCLLFYHLKYYCHFCHTKQKLKHCKTSTSACPETALSVKKGMWWKYIIKVPEVGFIWLNIDFYNMMLVISKNISLNTD